MTSMVSIETNSNERLIQREDCPIYKHKYILNEANKKKEWKVAWNSLVNVKMLFVNDKEKEKERESELFYCL